MAAANRAVEGMLLLIENRTPLEDQTVRYCISLAHDGAEKRVKELTEDFVTVTVKGRPIRPKTLGARPIWPLQWRSKPSRLRMFPASC